MQNENSRAAGSLWKSGHWPTLVSAFIYFDFSFMVWTVLGPLSAHIKEALQLNDQQTGLMVAVPSLGGAGLRLALGLLVDRIGAKNTGLIAQSVVMGALAWGWLAGLGSFHAVILMGFMLGFAGRVSRWRCRRWAAGIRHICKARCSASPGRATSAW